MAPRLSTGLTPAIKQTTLDCLNHAADMAIEDGSMDTAVKRERVKSLSAAITYVDSLTPASGACDHGGTGSVGSEGGQRQARGIVAPAAGRRGHGCIQVVHQ